jgi:dTDP-D-glucose 4,6-dehydratase
VYGETQQKKEQWVLCPTTPYAASKASAELLVTSFFHTFKLPVIIVRVGNVYGLHQSPDKIIPKFIRLLRDKKKLTVYGDGKKFRTFSHVYDVTNAIDFIVLNGVIGETYQMDNKKEECTILDIAKGLILLMVNLKLDTPDDFSPYLEFVEEDGESDSPDNRYYVSNDKLTDLGWVPEIPFIEGIVELIKIETK